MNTAKLDSFLNVLAANNKAMGSLAIAQNGKIVYQKAVGFAALKDDLKIPATAKTKYRVGSISKMFTGVMVMQLIEEGKLSLATTLDQFYPQMPNAARITIAQLMGHKSGLFNITNAPDFGTYMTLPQTHEAMVAKMAALKPAFEPGAKYEYSNTNFILLGYILEKVTGKPYPELVKQRIVNKLGLNDTYYGGQINPANNEALSYDFADKWKQLPQTDMSIPAGAGAMVSTPADLVKFIEALFAGKLVSKTSLAQMQPFQAGYGLAMRKSGEGDEASYGHNGAIDGFRAELSYFPAHKLAISYTSNGGIYLTDKVLKGVTNIVLNKPFELPTFKLITLKAEDLDKYIGVYTSPAFPLKITVGKNSDNTLYGQAAGQSQLQLDAVAKDKFEHAPADIHMEFNTVKGQFTLTQRGKIIVFTRE
ncbi:serine hydrolase domain-containing protein [Mucilaginibacter glaciei]|nr:serine hydrolase domain-containing protein [Mucilaginibacter glaciei]